MANAAKAQQPDLKKYMEKRLSVKLNGNRTVVGRLRGFDQFVSTVQKQA
jgi:small nuclear ribonucleoprotein G